jgi:hypothetical protein
MKKPASPAKKPLSPTVIVVILAIVIVVVIGVLALARRPKGTIQKNVDVEQKRAEMQQMMKGKRAVDQGL